MLVVVLFPMVHANLFLALSLSPLISHLTKDSSQLNSIPHTLSLTVNSVSDALARSFVDEYL